MRKKAYIATLALAALGAQAVAQDVETLGLSGIDIRKRAADVAVAFTVNPKAYHLGLTREMTLTPAFVSESGDTLRLEPVRIGGKNAWYYAMRNDAPGTRPMLRAGSGAPATYTASVPLERWLDKSRFTLLTCASGCCPGSGPGERGEVPVADIDWSPRTFSAPFAYVTPEVDTLKQFDISGRAYVNFKVNRTEIEPTYMNNPGELRKILETIDAVRDNRDATVQRIQLTGYASPEGPYANNVRLARERTAALRDYVSRQYDFPASVYATSSVSEDWAGLRDSVAASRLPQREAMLDFIDDPSTPIEVKNDRFRARFPEQYAYLLRTVYPWLRHTDYVITYKVRRYTDVEEIRRVMATQPGNLSLNELFIGARSYPQGSKEYNDAFELAAAIYPDSETANLNAANALMQRGDYTKAAEYLKKAGSGAEALYTRGMLAALQGDYEAAEGYFVRSRDKGYAAGGEALRLLDRARQAPDGVRYIKK